MLLLFRAPLIALLLAMSALAVPAYAADKLDQGLKARAAIPQPFMATDQTGKTRDFSSLIGKNGLIVLFNRSFDW
jgi:cytochrome oxidase Cu insertion factor (SCO1/SenC/PrrC family)